MLNPAELKSLRSYVESLGSVDYGTVAATLNSLGEDVPNPVAQTQVPKPCDMGEFFYLLKSPNDIAVVTGVAELVKAGQTLASATGTAYQPTLGGLLELMKSRGLTKGSYDAIKARIGETVPDPTWVATIPGRPLREQYEIFSEVTPEDVQSIDLGEAT
jgi:hypothetical protein